MQVDFYHLTAAPLDRVLPQIAEKVLAGGKRLLIVAEAEEQRRHLDRLLWTYSDDSFLPHACLGTGDAAAQPILLAEGIDAANDATHVALVDGIWRDDALGFERAFHFFDEATVRAAREAWKALAGRDDIERRYWKQNDGGRWEQAA